MKRNHTPPLGKPNKETLKQHLGGIHERDYKVNQPVAVSKKKPDYVAGLDAYVAKLKKDKALREAWTANIAMAMKDKYVLYRKRTGKKNVSYADIHIISNEAAEYFLQLLCDEIKVPEGR